MTNHETVAEVPSRDWWARRNKPKASDGNGGAG
jgi:hypothetical protein